MRLGWLAALALSCSSGAHPAGPKPQPGSGATETVASGPDAPSDRECDQLIAHAVELHVVELRATKPNQLPTDAEQQAARRDLRAALGSDCRRLTRTAYACAIAAKTTAELTGCDR